jgi:hypothetical protein
MTSSRLSRVGVTDPNRRSAGTLKRFLRIVAMVMFCPWAAMAEDKPSFVSIGGYRASDRIASKAVGAALTAAHVEYNLAISYGATIVVEKKDVEAALVVLRKLRDNEKIRLNLFETKKGNSSR